MQVPLMLLQGVAADLNVLTYSPKWSALIHFSNQWPAPQRYRQCLGLQIERNADSFLVRVERDGSVKEG